MLKTKPCEICATIFTNRRKNGRALSESQFVKARFCSLRCSAVHQIGIPKAKHTDEWKQQHSERMKREHAAGLRKDIFTPEARKRMSESAKKKPPMSAETLRKIGEAHTGPRNSGWKGDAVGYFGLHYWVSRQLGKPKECSHCGTVTARKFEWANISHEYRRDLTDWVRLCTTCHRHYDYGRITLGGSVS